MPNKTDVLRLFNVEREGGREREEERERKRERERERERERIRIIINNLE
jgi:hypothetical protein